MSQRGELESTPHGHGRATRQPTLQCVHCQAVWVPVRGSGRMRGFCVRCMGPTCGKACCVLSCVPAGRMLENMEAGLPLDHAPVIARVEAEPPGKIILG